MQKGPYIADRIMPQIVSEYCKRVGIDFHGFSDEWVLRLERDGVIKWIVGYKFDANSSAAGELAQDKVATFTALDAAGIPAIPHYLVRSLPKELIHLRELHQLLNGLPVVAKPLEGTSGRDVVKFESTDDALAMIRRTGEPAWALAPYHDLQAEYRLIMLDGRLLLSYEKSQPTYRDGLKLFNLSYGAIPVDITDESLRSSLLTIAERVMQATALRLAAVDIVHLPDNSLAVLEVNDGISMEHFARLSAENKARAISVYETIVDAMFK